MKPPRWPIVRIFNKELSVAVPQKVIHRHHMTQQVHPQV